MEFRIAHATFTGINSDGGIDNRAELERFAKHLTIVRHILRKKDAYFSAKYNLKFRMFHCTPGTLDGCKCPTDTCDCMSFPAHPAHAEKKKQMRPHLNALKREYRAVLEKYGVEHVELQISDDEEEA